MAPLEKEVLYVILDGQATGAFGVVPGKIDAGEAGGGHTIPSKPQIYLEIPLFLVELLFNFRLWSLMEWTVRFR